MTPNLDKKEFYDADKNKNINLVIDSDLLKEPYFCCHPCKNTSTLKFSTDLII